MSSALNRHLPSALTKVYENIFIIQLFYIDCPPFATFTNSCGDITSPT